MLLPGSDALPQPAAAVDGGSIQTNPVLTLPAIFAPDPSTARRVLEFFTAWPVRRPGNPDQDLQGVSLAHPEIFRNTYGRSFP
jgi:hypothetical protein